MVNQHNKVAYEVGETAFVLCRMQAYPRPSVEWSFGGVRLNAYDANVTAMEDDLFMAVLKINSVKHSDYGDYVCKATNTRGMLITCGNSFFFNFLYLFCMPPLRRIKIVDITAGKGTFRTI